MISEEVIARTQTLTESQVKCLRLVGRGMSSKEIALATGLSPRTVDQYVNRAASALGAASRREAARILDFVESEESNNLQLQSQALAESPETDSIGDSGIDRMSGGSAMRFLRWVPPLGGERNDLKTSETIGEIVKAALIAAIAFGSIVAVGAWLQTLFA